MFRCTGNKIGLFLRCAFLGLLLSCSNTAGESSTPFEPTPSEILAHFIQTKLGKETAEGEYFFVCGPYCKGCVQSTLLALDSLHKTLSYRRDWLVITSSKFVSNLPMQNIRIVYDIEWDRVNYEFNDVTYVKFIGDSIVKSYTVNVENLQYLK